MEIARSSSSTNHDLSVTIFKSEDLEFKSIIDWRNMTGQFVSRLQSLWLLEGRAWRVAGILCDLLTRCLCKSTHKTYDSERVSENCPWPPSKKHLIVARGLTGQKTRRQKWVVMDTLLLCYSFTLHLDFL